MKVLFSGQSSKFLQFVYLLTLTKINKKTNCLMTKINCTFGPIISTNLNRTTVRYTSFDNYPTKNIIFDVFFFSPRL